MSVDLPALATRMLQRTLSTTLALLCLCAAAAAGGLKAQVLMPGEARVVRAIRARDLTGDGKREILAFLDGPGGIAVAIHGRDEKGGFRSPPDRVIVPAKHGLVSVYYACVARLSPGKGAEIVFVDRTGIFAFPLSGPPRRLGDAPSLPFHPDDDHVNVFDVNADLDGDGIEELLLPAAAGFRIFRVKDPGATGGPATGSRHTISVEAHRFLTLHWELPLLTVADWDGDGLLDLVAGREGELLLYLQKKDGSFLAVDPHPLDVLKTRAEGAERITLNLGDVDGDRRVDLLLTQTPSTVELLQKFTSQQSLFLNPRIFSPGTRGKLSTPAVSFKLNGFSVNPALTDFDGDGDLDLLVTALDYDVWGKLRGSVSAEYQLFRFDARKKVFERKPYFKVARPFPPDQLERQSTAPVCFFTGDFNGDGKKDLLDIADSGHITILAGTTDTGFLNPDPFAFKKEILKIKPREAVGNDVWIGDLNGDGVSDLIAHGERRIYVIRSVP